MNPLAVAVADCWALQALISVLSAIRSMSCWEMGANCMAKSVSSALNSIGFPRSVKDAPTVSRRFVAAAWVALNTEKLIVTKIVISVKSRNRVSYVNRERNAFSFCDDLIRLHDSFERIRNQKISLFLLTSKLRP